MPASSQSASESDRALALRVRRNRQDALRDKYATPVIVYSRDEVSALDSFTKKYRAISESQAEAIEAVKWNAWVLFGGAKGGAKSVGGVRIVQHYVATSRDGIALVCRRNYTDLHRTTKKSYERFFPPELILEGGKTTDVWYCVNGWQIWFYAADERLDPNFEKLGGLEVTIVLPDEVSQQGENFYKAVSATMRLDAFDLVTGEPIPHFVYATANPTPGDHWTKRHFINPKTRRTKGYRNAEGQLVGHKFIQSLPDNNPLLPATYITVAFGNMDGPMLEMLRYGRWDIDISDLQIIPSATLELVTIDSVIDRVPVGAGIDVGLGRPDMTCVWCVNASGQMWRALQMAEYDTEEQTDKLDPICAAVNARGGKIYIDLGDVGKGVADKLRRRYGATVVGIWFGESAVQEDGVMPGKYKNHRAQLYFQAREDVAGSAKMVQAGQRPILQVERCEALANELNNTFYLPTDGRLQLELKPKITARIGHSPDDADAFVLCNAARRQVVTSVASLPAISARARERRPKTKYPGFRI